MQSGPELGGSWGEVSQVGYGCGFDGAVEQSVGTAGGQTIDPDVARSMLIFGPDCGRDAHAMT